MKWNKPQRLIKNSLFTISLLSLIGAVFWLSLFYIWVNHPNLVNDYDKNMPDKYTNTILRLHTRTFKGKSPEDTLKRHKIFTKALDGITQLHKFYDRYSDSQIFIIDYLLAENRLLEAQDIAYTWQQNYPYDFTTKFKYADVLVKIDKQKALEYYSNIYTRYKDIYKFNQKYTSLLLSQGEFNKALKIAEYAQTQNRKQSHLKFSFYYTDNSNPKYSAKTKHFVEDHKSISNQHLIKVSFKVDGLKKLRFDIDRLVIGSKLSNIYFNISTPTKTFKNIKASPLHHLEEQNNSLISTGKDPYLQLLLPETLMGTSHEIQIEVFISIEKKKNFVLDTITQHTGWEFNCSTDENFAQNKPRQFFLTHTNNQYLGLIDSQQTCTYIKFGFPSLKNLSFSDLNIQVGNTVLSQNNILRLNGINQLSENSFITESSESEPPYIIYKSEEPLAADMIKIKMSLGNEQ